MQRRVGEGEPLEQSGWPDGELQDTEPTHRVITRRARDKTRSAPSSDDPCEILGVRRGATVREIRAAYLRLVKELHPDGRTPDPDADERLKAINAAYRKLKAGGAGRRGWARGAVFTVGVLTSALPLLAIMGAYYGGWLGSRAPTPGIVGAPEAKGGVGTTSVEKDSAVGRQIAFADAKKQATKSAWAKFIADYPGGQPEAFAHQAIADLERAEVAEARKAPERLAWSAAEKGTRADLQQFLARYADGEHAGKAREALAAIARTEQAAWMAAERAGTKEALKRFLDEHPEADQVPRAIKALAAIVAAEAKAKTELAAWTAAERAGTKEALQRFLDAHPEADQVPRAIKAMAAIAAAEAKVKTELAAWAAAERAGTKEALQRFLDAHRDAPQAAQASKALAAIAAAEARATAELETWLKARGDGSKAALRKYLSEHPSGLYAPEAKALVARLEADERDDEAWRLALQGNSKAAYAGYLSAHPNGRRVAEARMRIAELGQAEAHRKDAVKEARVEPAVKAPAVRPPRGSTAGGGEVPFIGADGRIRR
jgi:hypothetical protein